MVETNLCAFFLGLLLCGLFAGGLLGGVLLLLVHDQPRPAFFLVPLEAGEVGLLQFVVRLGVVSVLLGVSMRGEGRADLLLELLVDGVHGILDGDTLQIPGGDLQTQGEVQVNLLDWGSDEVEFEDVLVLDGVW